MAASYDYQAMRDEALSQGLTQAQVAKLSGLSQQSVSRFFTGQSRGPKSAKAIAEKALGLPLRAFVITDTSEPVGAPE